MADKVSAFSFGTSPTGDTAAVINPSVPSAMESVLAPSNVKGANANNPALDSVSPQQFAEMENDFDLQKELEEAGKTTREYVKEVQAVLPKSAGKLGDVLKEGNSVKDTYEAAKRLKKNLNAGVYNDIQSDAMALTTKMSKKLTDLDKPLGDYFCRLDSSILGSITDGLGFSFDLDKAIKSALAGALAAVGVNNKCGFDSVSFIKDNVGGLVDAGMEKAVAIGVMDEAAAKGTADAVADLAAVYGDDMSTGGKLKMAGKLAKNFLPEEATSLDSLGALKDGLTSLVPGFGDKGSDDRKNLMSEMKDETLDALAEDKEYRNDALAAKSTKSEKSFFDKMKDQYNELVS